MPLKKLNTLYVSNILITRLTLTDSFLKQLDFVEDFVLGKIVPTTY